MSNVISIDPEHRVKELEGYVKQLQQGLIKANFDLAAHQKAIQNLLDIHNHTSGYIYIASPYTHKESEVVHDRYMRVMYYTMKLLQNRQWCYSPIVHSHEMARLHSLPTDAIFWMDYNYAMLSQARELHVLCLPGWKESVGVKSEVAFWRHAKGSHPMFVEP